MHFVVNSNKSEILKVEDFSVGDYVAYSSTMGGPIISRGHRIVSFKMIDPAKEIVKVSITGIEGFVPIENIFPDGHFFESQKSVIDLFLDQPIEKAFEISCAVYRRIDRRIGLLMIKSVVEKMEKEIP